jgi:hypothetical protein
MKKIEIEIDDQTDQALTWLSFLTGLRPEDMAHVLMRNAMGSAVGNAKGLFDFALVAFCANDDHRKAMLERFRAFCAHNNIPVREFELDAKYDWARGAIDTNEFALLFQAGVIMEAEGQRLAAERDAGDNPPV